VTVFFTTHIMEEAEYICDRIAIIDHGKILALDTVENVKKKFGGVNVIHLHFAEYNDDVNLKLQNLPGVQKIVAPQLKDDPLKIFTEDANLVLPRVIELATSLGLRITEIGIKEPSLDDVFVQMVNSKGGNHHEQLS
jgi:ABC-2 type transport system ATP-binding protein